MPSQVTDTVSSLQWLTPLSLQWFLAQADERAAYSLLGGGAKHVCDVKELCVIVPDWPARPQEKSLPIDRFFPGNRQRWAEHEQSRVESRGLGDHGFVLLGWCAS